MNKVYDNGTMVLGTKKDVEKYLKDNMFTSDMEDEIFEILKDIQEEKEDTILAINYDLGMGYSIDYWTTEDIVMEKKDE